MNALCCLLAATCLAGVRPNDRPRPDVPDRDVELAVAGLEPFSKDTDFLSLPDFHRQRHGLKPDLVITRVVLEPAEPRPGDTVQATIFYKNIGGKTAKSFYLHLAPGSVSSGGFGLGGDYAQAEPGEEKEYSWGALRAPEAGTHTLLFSIDPERTVDESNRRNNSFTIYLRVTER